jgi:hypothetical protein
MTPELRVVFDTSVIVSAVLLPRSVPRQAFDRAREGGKLLVSDTTFEELHEVRERFDKYVSQEQRQEFLAALIDEAELVPVTEVVTDCRDPKDNKFLELAVSGKAKLIVTGDRDLLVLHPFREIAILSPHDFLRLSEVK